MNSVNQENYENNKLKYIYLDNAATMPISDSVKELMSKYSEEYYANASSDYKIAKETREIVEQSRRTISDIINCDADEIYFTSGGTESDNWAIKMIVEKMVSDKKRNRLLISEIEHHAVINAAKRLKEKGVDVEYIKVYENGIINIDDLKRKINNRTYMVSVMMVNNEIGVIEPISMVSSIAKRYGALCHSDAVAAFGHIKIDVKKLKLDMMSASGHKFGSPKGVGFLYAKNNIKMYPFMNGGGQEKSLRAGTYNMNSIAGMAMAARNIYSDFDKKEVYLKNLQSYFVNRILKEIPECKINGDMMRRVSSNVNVSFKYINSNIVVKLLDSYGICASAGSACNSDVHEPSHVIKAIKNNKEYINGTLRFTFNTNNTINELDYTVDVLKYIIFNMREINNKNKKMC